MAKVRCEDQTADGEKHVEGYIAGTSCTRVEARPELRSRSERRGDHKKEVSVATKNHSMAPEIRFLHSSQHLGHHRDQPESYGSLKAHG